MEVPAPSKEKPSGYLLLLLLFNNAAFGEIGIHIFPWDHKYSVWSKHSNERYSAQTLASYAQSPLIGSLDPQRLFALENCIQ